METVTLKAEVRNEVGTRAAQAIRVTGRVPVVIYGHGEPPESASLCLHDVKVALAHGVRTLQLDLNGATRSYLIKEVQYDHMQIAPIHLDLARVDLSERVRVRVGIELRGVPTSVSAGGVLEQHMADMQVECLVAEIPDTLHPMVTDLGLGELLLVKDLVLPPGVIALATEDDRVASGRELIEAPPAEEAPEGEEAAAEPERIGRVRKEEG